MTTSSKYRALSFAYPGRQDTLAAAAAPPAVKVAAFGPESGEIKVELAKWEAMVKKEEDIIEEEKETNTRLTLSSSKL